MLKERIVAPAPEYEVPSTKDLLALIEKASELENTEVVLLAVASQIVGKILAMQDWRTMTPERAMAIVQKNIEIGKQVSGKSADAKT